MPAILPTKLRAMSRVGDSRKAIWNAVGDALGKIKVFGPQILVGTFIGRDRIGTILLPDSAIQEALWQGCLGLVLQKGPRAFQDEPENNIFWFDQNIEIDDWVVFRFSSAWEFHLNGVSVRLVDDRDIKAVIENPDLLMSKPIVALGG